MSLLLFDKKKSIVVVSDTMTNGNIINSNLWTTIDTVDTVTIQQVNNIGLQFTGTHTAGSSNFNNQIKSIKNIKNGIIAVQSNFIWTPNVQNTEASAGLILWFDNNNYAYISSRGSDIGGGTYRLTIIQNNISVYVNTTTGISNGKDVKITYNYSTNEIKFWYWNNIWIQIDVTKIFNIDNNNPAFILIQYVDILNAIGNDTATFKNVFFSSNDYNSNYPI